MTSSRRGGSQGDEPERPNREETDDQRPVPEARSSSLRESFPGHFRPTGEQFDRLWDGGMFVVDTNVLLNLYRYSRATREELLNVLRALDDKLFLPHQVGQEFLERRLPTIRGQREKVAKLRERVRGETERVEKELRGILRLRAKEELPGGLKEALAKVPGGYEELAERLEELERGLPEASASPDDDEAWAAVEGLFDGRVGPPFDGSEAQKVLTEAERRREGKIPPGFRDERPGDYVLWRQTVNEAKRSGKPVVIVTDDRKDDWWWIEEGRTLGPHRALVEEMSAEAGMPLYMYTPDRLMGEARRRLGVEVSDESINEAEGLGRMESDDFPPVIRYGGGPGLPYEPFGATRAEEFRRVGHERFQQEKQRRDLLYLPRHGSWEAAIVLAGDLAPPNLDRAFLDLINARNPRYSGWPVWIDSRGLVKDDGTPDTESAPYTFEGGWEAFISNLQRGGMRRRLDFWRIEPIGRFYLYRAFQDDLATGPQAPEPMSELDFVLPILRTAEAIAAAIAFGKAMGALVEGTTLHCAFRWDGIGDRELSAWARSGLEDSRYGHLEPCLVSRQRYAESLLSVPLATPDPVLGRYVREATAPLYSAFSGFAPEPGFVEDLTDRLLSRSF